MQEGFLTNVDTLTLFFRVCRRYHLDKENERIALLRQLTRRGQAKYLRDVDETIAGKKVLRIERKRTPNEN